jgi:hypothetical protein
MDARTQKCPLCAEAIPLDARICPYCNAQFDVKVLGYCSHCRAKVELDANDHCSRCGGEIIDWHVNSKLVGESASAPVPSEQIPVAPAPVANVAYTPIPQTVETPRAPVRRPGCVTALAVLFILAAAGAGIGGVIGGVNLATTDVAGGVGLIVGVGIVAVLYGALASGLLQMKSWARIVMMILMGLGMIFYIIGIISSFFVPASTYGGSNIFSLLCAFIVSLSIQGSIYNWFAKNKEKFQ